MLESEVCSICFESEVDYSTECNHNFCNNCIANWLLLNNSCPICRKVFYNNDEKFNGYTLEERIIGIHYIFYRIYLEQRHVPKHLFVIGKLPNNINISYFKRLYRFDNQNFNNCSSRY